MPAFSGIGLQIGLPDFFPTFTFQSIDCIHSQQSDSAVQVL